MNAARVARSPKPGEDAGTAETLLRSEAEACLDGVLLFRDDHAVAAYNRRFADMWSLAEHGTPPRTAGDVFRILELQVRDPAILLAEVRRFRADPTALVHREIELLDGRIFETRWSLVTGPTRRARGRICFFRDVTEQRRSAAALRASHALLATTERIAHVGGWEWDIAANRLVWSAEASRMFGRAHGEFEPTLAAFLATVHPGDRARVERHIEASLHEGAPYDVEFRIVRPDGTERVVHAQAEVTFDVGGKALRMTGTAHDVTDARAAQDALRFSNALATAQLESSPDGILVVDARRRILSYNRKFVDMWRVDDEVLQRRDDAHAIACVIDRVKDRGRFLDRLDELYANPGERSHEEIELTDGSIFERHSGPLVAEGGESLGRIFFFRDVTARRKAEEQIARLARQDALTGLANRAVFVQSVQRAITTAQRSGTGLALLYLDLDHFKDVNDTLGHPAGDDLLQQVAERLRSCVRSPDVVSRFGGDEFAVLLSDVDEATDAAALAERIQGALKPPFAVLGSEVRIGVSIGIAWHGPGVPSAEMLLSHADLALYRAKSDGRGTYRFFVEAMDLEVRRRVSMASELRQALDADQFFLEYQPQLEIATGRITGVEALLRWRHPVRGVIGPAEFIPAAEKSGLIVPIGRHVMRQACRRAKAWLDAGIAPDTIAVNVSGRQFHTLRDLQAATAAILAETGLPPERLELEFTEGVLANAWTEERESVVGLRQTGVRMTIDDFGTGLCSLQHLGRLPVDRLKIGQAFVATLGSSPENAAIVKAAIGLARELGFRVVAEGIETQEQLEQIRAWGCRDGQGYFLAKPLSAAEVEGLLRARSTPAKVAAAE